MKWKELGNVYCAVANGCLSETVYVSNGSLIDHHQVENEKCTVEKASSIAHFSFTCMYLYSYFLPVDGRTKEECPREIIVKSL